MDIKAEHKVWLSKHVVSYLMLALLILCIVPAIYIGIYAHPSVDDYYYGTVTAEAWKDTGSFLSVIKTSAEQTAERYENWQGNFVAIFLMGLMPAVFGEAYYVITPILLILSFVLCSYFFYSVLFRDVMCAKRDESRILTCLFVLLSFELTLKPSDAFYWFNGGSYYCFFYSLMLLLAGCILRMICEKFTAKRLCWLFVCLPLAFLIGGSNYPTAFISTLLLLFLSLVLILKKNRNYIGTIPVAVVCMVSLLISMMAPGNSIRQESVGESFGAIKAILVSFAYGGYCIANSTTFLIIIILIAILPIMFCLVRRSEWKFSHPYIVILLSYCFFSAQATPVI